MASTSRMLARNWLPSPSPLEAPRTRPAISTNSRLVGTTFTDLPISASISSRGSGTATQNGSSWFFLHFNNVAVDAGANWTLTGTDQAATITDNGSVNVTGSLDVTSAVDPASSGVFLLNGGASMEVAAALGTATRFSFATGSKLTVDAAGSFGTGVGTSGYAGPSLQNFTSGDTIDLLNFGNAGSSFTYNAGSGLLQLNNGAAQAASLDFQTSSLGGSTFQLASDGGNGTLVTRV